MNLGIFLSPGDSFLNMSKSGQDGRFVKNFLEKYSKQFKKIYIYSYDDESYSLPENVILIPNKTKLHRLIYGIILPLINYRTIKDCDVIRGFGLASAISSFLLSKPFTFNWAYDYISFVKMDNKRRYILPYLILEKLAFMKAKKVFVQTKEKYNSLPAGKFVYLPNGVDLKVFKKGENNIYKLVFIGRLEKQKNLDLLLGAIGELPKNKRKLLIIGNGSLEKQVKKLARKNEIELELVPKVDNAKLPGLMGKYQVFVLSSFYEGVPKVLQEAMALGCVPVVTSFPTAKEVVTNGVDGIITGYGKKEFSDGILKVIKDKRSYRKLSENAVYKIKNEFDIENLIQREIGTLKNV